MRWLPDLQVTASSSTSRFGFSGALNGAFSQDDSIIRLLKARYNLEFLLLTSVLGYELICEVLKAFGSVDSIEAVHRLYSNHIAHHLSD